MLHLQALRLRFWHPIGVEQCIDLLLVPQDRLVEFGLQRQVGVAHAHRNRELEQQRHEGLRALMGT